VNDTGHLRDKQVLIRFVGNASIFHAIVKNVEANGLWAEMPSMVGQLAAADLGWQRMIQNIREPVFFVPFSSVTFLIAVKE
jgi:hypothetical protein